MSTSYDEQMQQSKTAPFNAAVQSNEFGQLPTTVQQQLVDTTARQHIRNNSALPSGSWKAVDDEVYQTLDSNLTIVNDLRAAGLTSSIPVSARFSNWNVVDDRGEATVAMSPETEDGESTVTFAPRLVPVPCIFDSFSTGFRQQAVPGEAPSGAQSIDTLGANTTSRNVAVTLENLTWSGWDTQVFEMESGQSVPLYGLLTHPDRNTGQLENWGQSTVGGGSTVSPMDIRKDIREMRNTLKNPPNNWTPVSGGFWLYLSTDLYDHMDDLTDRENTVQSLVNGLASISRISEAEQLPPGNAVMFSPEPSVIDLCIPRAPTPIQWTEPPGFRDRMMVLSIFAPRVKSTKSGQSGIAHFVTPDAPNQP